MVNNSFISNIYVGNDGKLHKVQGGADSVLPFSSVASKTAYANSTGGNGYQTSLSITPNQNAIYGYLIISAIGVHGNGSRYSSAYASIDGISGGMSASLISENNANLQPGSEGIANYVAIYKINNVSTTGAILVNARCGGAATLKGILIV